MGNFHFLKSVLKIERDREVTVTEKSETMASSSFGLHGIAPSMSEYKKTSFPSRHSFAFQVYILILIFYEMRSFLPLCVCVCSVCTLRLIGLEYRNMIGICSSQECQ